MKFEFNQYFKPNYLMAPHGENDILYTAQYCVLAEDTPEKMHTHQKMRAVWSQIKSFKPPILNRVTRRENYSHDNMTALVCLSKHIGMNVHETFFWSDWHYRLHPRDIIFYMYAKNGFARGLVLPFLWILSLCMIISMANSHYKIIDGEKVLATDGKLLTWLRLNTFDFPITKYFCDKIVKKKYGGYQNLFLRYFGPNHPNTILAKAKNI